MGVAFITELIVGEIVAVFGRKTHLYEDIEVFELKIIFCQTLNIF